MDRPFISLERLVQGIITKVGAHRRPAHLQRTSSNQPAFHRASTKDLFFLTMSHSHATESAAEEYFRELVAKSFAVSGEYDPHAPLKTTDFDQYTDRTFYVTLKGSLEQFENGEIVPVWSADPGCEHIYQRIAGYDGDKPIYAGSTDMGLLFDMHLETLSSNFPVDLGAVITNVSGTEYTANGRNYAFIAEAHCRQEPNKRIFLPKSNVSRAALEKYTNTSAQNLRAKVYQNAYENMTFVENDSPIAHMLRLNADSLNISFDLPEGKEGFLRVATPLVEACLKRYEEDQQVDFIDMKQFSVAFERIDSPDDWTRDEGLIDNMRSQRTDDKTRGAHNASQRKTNEYKLVAKINTKMLCLGE